MMAAYTKFFRTTETGQTRAQHRAGRLARGLGALVEIEVVAVRSK